MRSIQDVGKEVLSGQPSKFYVFAGTEYGIKSKYISMLQNHYGNCVEADSLESIITLMTTKRLIPLQPSLYVVRYDESFISSVNDKSAARVAAMNIIGTVVCLYQDPNHTHKCDKYLTDYTVEFTAVSPAFVKQYLTADFPGLPSSLIDLAINMNPSYQAAKNICYSMSVVNNSSISNTPVTTVTYMFGCNTQSCEDDLKIGIASRNFGYIVSVLDTYQADLSTVYYTILSTMLELEKVLTCRWKLSAGLAKYKDRWDVASIYHMFMHTYAELQKVRSFASFNVYGSIIYLISLLQFSSIPTLEVMSNGVN